MNILFIYNPRSGKGLKPSKLENIKKLLGEKSSHFEFRLCENLGQLYQVLSEPLDIYDILVFAGGDGTFHHVVNALSAREHRPTLGIIPCGTLNDASKNYGYSRRISRCIDIILNGVTKPIDVFKVNNQYGIFSLSVGTFSDIPYKAKRSGKKRFRVLSYYGLAIKSLFRKGRISGNVILNNEKHLYFEAPFLLMLNSRYMGGFKINKKAKLDDGLADLLYTKKGWFNGLYRYFLRPKKVTRLAFSRAEISLDNTYSWDIDGEEFQAQKVEIQVLKNHLKILAKR